MTGILPCCAAVVLVCISGRHYVSVQCSNRGDYVSIHRGTAWLVGVDSMAMISPISVESGSDDTHETLEIHILAIDRYLYVARLLHNLKEFFQFVLKCCVLVMEFVKFLLLRG